MRQVLINTGGRLVLPIAFVAVVMLAGCGGSGGQAAGPTTAGASAASATASASASADAVAGSAASLPPGGRPGLDDYDGDGVPDPTCGTQDFGAGLVLRIPCVLTGAHEPENGARLVKNSLYRLPAAEADLTGISGELVTARDAAGAKVVILVFNSDELFATGSDVINSAGTLDATIRLINAHYPGGAVQVRGHTDGTGAPAANQALSQRRADHVHSYLTAHATSAASISSVGLGSSQPLTEEKSPDGSVSTAGRAFNRRVELVIRLP